MAHFTRIRDIGMWTISVLMPDELERLDTSQFAAINGDAGGTWAPSSPILIGGRGLQIVGAQFLASGTVVLGGDVGSDIICNAAISGNAGADIAGNIALSGSTGAFTCAKPATFYNVAAFNGATEFTDAVSCAGAVSFTGTASNFACYPDAQFTGSVSILGGSGALTCTKAAAFDSTVAINGRLGCSGDVILGDDADDVLDVRARSVFAGGVEIRGDLTLLSTGRGARVLKRVVVSNALSSGANGNTGDIWYLTNGGIVFLESGAKAGTFFRVVNASSSTIGIYDSTGAQLTFTMAAQTWIDLVRDPSGPHGWLCVGSGSHSPLV